MLARSPNVCAVATPLSRRGTHCRFNVCRLWRCFPLQVRQLIDDFKVGAPARVGLVAPNDVTIPAGNTGMDPSQTSFFQVGTLRIRHRPAAALLGSRQRAC